MSTSVWTDPAVMQWSQWLLDSHRRWTGLELIERTQDRKAQSQTLFEAPFVVVSHGVETDPILNYGNRQALDLWETSWARLIQTPSRLTAEQLDRTERERMLEEARSRGFFEGYRGVRVSSTGRRFLVENALIWTVVDASGSPVGQAASFSHWTWLS